MNTFCKAKRAQNLNRSRKQKSIVSGFKKGLNHCTLLYIRVKCKRSVKKNAKSTDS
jgi:hypothetical protein